MAGIVGIIGEDRSNEDRLGTMVSKLSRGDGFKVVRYDDEGIHVARVHLGKFNDEDRPLFDQEHQVMVLVHGKIYRDETCGTEIDKDASHCLKRYLEDGIDFVKGLNGNFVIIIHDHRIKATFVVNDRFGFRPHYYSQKGAVLYLSPEPKAILSVIGGCEVARESIAEFFARGEFWGGRTWFKEIKILGPASILKFQDGTVTSSAYWEMKYEPDRSMSDRQMTEMLIGALRNAVTARMTPGLKIGTSLSGGMDSRTIIAAMTPEQRKTVTSLTFGSDDCGEVEVASKVAKVAGIKKHVVMDVTPDMILENAAKDVELTEGRLFVGLAFVHPMFEALKRDVDVLMDGFAMDLTLGGSYLTDDMIDGISVQGLKEKVRGKRLFTDSELAELLKDENLDERLEWLDETIDEEFSKLKSDETANMWDEFFMRTHVAWMHIGDVPLLEKLEVAHPSSDNRFIDLLVKIPPEERMRHKFYRTFLIAMDKDLADVKYYNTGCKVSSSLAYWKISSFRILLSESIKYRISEFSHGQIDLPRRKSYVNFDDWFRTNARWREYFEKVLLDETDGSGRYVNMAYIKRLLSEQYKGKNNATKLIHIATFKLFLKANQSLS